MKIEQLIPVSVDKVAELEQKLSESMFQSIERFVEFYNSGMVNKNDDNVKDYANLLESAYKNVKLQGRDLMFLSEEEVFLKEILETLQMWEVVVKVRNRVQEHDEDAAFMMDDGVSAGYLYERISKEDGFEEWDKVSGEKFFAANDTHILNRLEETFGKTFTKADLDGFDANRVRDIYDLVKN